MTGCDSKTMYVCVDISGTGWPEGGEYCWENKVQAVWFACLITSFIIVVYIYLSKLFSAYIFFSFFQLFYAFFFHLFIYLLFFPMILYPPLLFFLLYCHCFIFSIYGCSFRGLFGPISNLYCPVMPLRRSQ